MRKELKITIVATCIGFAGILALILRHPGLFGWKDSVRRIDREPVAILLGLETYRQEFGVFPVGDTAAVCRALLGENSHKKPIMSWEPRSISPAGEFLDPWGTPYKIYFSGDQPLIRSAGANRRFDGSLQDGGDDYFGG